jgi:hypothetical protein
MSRGAILFVGASALSALTDARGALDWILIAATEIVAGDNAGALAKARSRLAFGGHAEAFVRVAIALIVAIALPITGGALSLDGADEGLRFFVVTTGAAGKGKCRNYQ